MPTAQSLLLFGLERSVYTRIARLALEEKGVPYSLREVEIFGPGGVPQEHLRRHPFGRIPVLQHGNFSLYETGAITRYVDERISRPRLQPLSPPAARTHEPGRRAAGRIRLSAMVWGVFVQRCARALEWRCIE